MEARNRTLVYRWNWLTALAFTARVENGVLQFASPGVWPVIPKIEVGVTAAGSEANISVELSWLGIDVVRLKGTAQFDAEVEV